MSQEASDAENSIHLTFRVLDWQLNDAIGIKYPSNASKEQMQADMAALAQVHGWKAFNSDLEITYEHGKKTAWKSGKISKKRHLSTDFTLNFQALREQFPDAESIIIDLTGKNGFAYQGTFTSSVGANDGINEWQNQFPFRKNLTDIAKYRIRYIIRPAQFTENTVLPTLIGNASFSKAWLFKVIPLAIFLMFVPSATLHLFLRRGILRNERGKIKVTPFQMVVLTLEFHAAMLILLHLGCAEVCSALIQNAILGFIFSVGLSVAISFLLFMWTLHYYEKSARGTTWSFQENILTNLRMVVLGTPMLLLPFCYFGTQKAFPHLSFIPFIAFILFQYTLLTSLFGCVIPFVMGWIWKGKPLEDNTLRERLQQLAERAKIDYRDIVLLKTKSSKLANAWVAGILPQWRSVFVTDYLLEHLTYDEIETIFAHELGHLKHQHLLKQVAWIVLGFGGQLSLVRLSLLLFHVTTGLPLWIHLMAFVCVIFGGIFLLVQFGLMRFWRGMEFEADAYAVQLTQQPTVFLQALRKLIQLNDAPEDLDTFNEMLSTHPNFKARADAIEKL